MWQTLKLSTILVQKSAQLILCGIFLTLQTVFVFFQVKLGDYIRNFQQSYVKDKIQRLRSDENIQQLFERAQISVIGKAAAKNSA